MTDPTQPIQAATPFEGGYFVEPPDAADFRQALMSVLQLEGCEPSIEEDNDIFFQRGGYAYCLHFDAKDPEFAQLIIPSFHRIQDEADLHACLWTADRINGNYKCVKIVTSRLSGGVTMHAVLEFLVADLKQIVPVVLRSADSLADAVYAFRLALRLLS